MFHRIGVLTRGPFSRLDWVGNRLDETESASGLPQADGDAGQASLERTDAKTTASSLGVSTQGPSTAREGGDTHGPLG